MKLYLYGVLFDEEAKEMCFGPIGFDRTEVNSIPAGRLTAVVGTPPRGDLKGKTKEELVCLLLAHQKTVEAIMENDFILPFKFGSTVADASELIYALRKGCTLLSAVADQMRECQEIDVIATWDVAETLKEISEEDPEILACKKKAATGSVDRSFVGMLLASALKKKAETLRAEMMAILESHAASWVDHDLMNDEMVLNSSFLVKKRQEQEFFRSVEEMDRKLGGKLHFKCVGPLPPYSFATITVKRFDPDKIAQAARILHLTGTVEGAEVKQAYKELSRKRHPDTNPGIAPAEFEQLNQAYKWVVDYVREGPQSLEKSAVETYLRLEVCGVPNAQGLKPFPASANEGSGKYKTVNDAA